MKQTSTTKINWKAIVGKIRKEKCILILGPGAYRSKRKGTLQNELLQFLEIEKNEYIQKYYEEDNFFLFQRGGGRAFTCEKIEEFYKSKQPDEILKQLVEIPFHVILAVTPDKLLPTAFEEAGFSFQFDFYKKLHEPAVIQRPSQELPLIYNLFGCVEDEESLVLTHNDLYDYFKSIFARKSMPDKLKQALREKEINCFLFLGVPFDKWYMQLLLRELEIHRSHEDFIRYAANQTLSDEVKTFCTEQFTIQFVDQHIPEFVQTLHQHCHELELRRERGKDTKWNQLQELIIRGDLSKAIEQFNVFTSGTELKREADGLSARYNRFERRKRNGVLDSRDIPVQENQITTDLIALIEEAKTI